MAVADSMESVVRASLLALLSPPADASSTAPRGLLSGVSRDWDDDARAWHLARRLIPQAEAYVEEVERQASEHPRDEHLANLRSRARYAHIIALALYRELRVPARRQPYPLP